MFGVSLSKVLFTIAVVVIVWGAFKYYGRMLGHGGRRESLRERVERAAQEAVRRRMGDDHTAEAPRREAAADSDTVEDLVRCPGCGAWHPRGTSCACGRRA